MDKTYKELLKEIRKLAGLEVSADVYFLREEIKAIASIINPAVLNITDDTSEKLYCRTRDIFGQYIPGVWSAQGRVGHCPNKVNLISICSKIKEIKSASAKQSPTLTDTKVKVEVNSNTSMSNIKDIFNSLPEVFRIRAKSIEIKSSDLTISINLSD